MPHALTVLARGADPERREILGPLSAGGSRADGLLLPGAPARALRLLPLPAGVVVEAGAPGVRVGGHPVAPGARRLLRPGERAELRGLAVILERAPPPEATRVAASALLRDAARGASPGAGPGLVVLTGPQAGERHPLGAEATIGRGRAAVVRVRDPLASRLHARLRARPGGATLEDLGSKNGVRVNGVAVDRRPCLLAPGDEIAIGETLLALEDPWPDPPASSEPRPAPPRRAGIPPRLAAAVLLALSAAALALAGS
jgi:hypothetical protein